MQEVVNNCNEQPTFELLVSSVSVKFQNQSIDNRWNR